MKNMKKWTALILALVLAFALASTASAIETDGSITINKTDDDNSYAVFKIFDAQDIGNSFLYTPMSDEWGSFTADAYFEVNDGYIAWISGNSDSNAAGFAALAKTYAIDNDLNPTKTATATSDTLVIDGLSYGYYLIMPIDADGNYNGGICGVATASADGAQITEKNKEEGLPRVDKTVEENSTGAFGPSNDDEIGQTVTFQTVITVKEGGEEYILHDEMAAGLEFDSISSVTHQGIDVDTANYTVVTESLNDDCAFHIEFTNAYIDDLTTDDEIVVEYTATLTDSATIGSTGNVNETWLTHTDAAVETNHSTTTTYTYQIPVLKVDQDNAPLSGAGFMLMDMNDYYFSVDSDGAVSWVASKEDGTELFSGTDGKLSFVGLDSGDYTLTETTVPEGYAAASDASVSVDSDDAAEVTVMNRLGQLLPETGGIGTTLFYVAGAALLLCAAFLLISKKRSSAKK